MLRRGEEGQERDYLELSFAAGDRIFVPVEQINRVSRYSGGEARSCRDWAARTGCGRSSGSGRRSPTSPRSSSACTRSARRRRGSPTPSTRRGRSRWRRRSRTRRRRTSSAPRSRSRSDMETRRPMDRLVVGDVGYGKTEVALRAAFKATQDGKQVAVLVPTTVLAGQHFTTFSQRFAAFPITVRAAVPVRRGEGAGHDDRGAGGRRRGHRHRDAPAAVEGRRVQGPRPGGRGRGAAVRGRGQGAPQAAAVRGGRAHALSATPIPRTLNLALAGIRDL